MNGRIGLLGTCSAPLLIEILPPAGGVTCLYAMSPEVVLNQNPSGKRIARFLPWRCQRAGHALDRVQKRLKDRRRFAIPQHAEADRIETLQWQSAKTGGRFAFGHRNGKSDAIAFGHVAFD